MENEETNWLQKTETELLALVYKYACNGLRHSAKFGQDWLNRKKISPEISMACFNSGQLHHRKAQEFKDAYEKIGLLKRSSVATNNGQIPYSLFGTNSIMFPLKNQNGQIVNFYAIGILNNKAAFFNQQGIYPAYPAEQTKKLFVVDSILEAATMLEAKVLDNREAVIALHDGIVSEEHQKMINSLTQLKKVVHIKSKK